MKNLRDKRQRQTANLHDNVRPIYTITSHFMLFQEAAIHADSISVGMKDIQNSSVAIRWPYLNKWLQSSLRWQCILISQLVYPHWASGTRRLDADSLCDLFPTSSLTHCLQMPMRQWSSKATHGTKADNQNLMVTGDCNCLTASANLNWIAGSSESESF